ncbi:MAG TPA: ArsR family transcriptional regulator [Mariniphaga anaerophila]|uniref:ArsR family transcriptional regulator n=1 Tax=Mariniphaga anaerophila TaxID=1484053 RepID=A0A831PQE5_9BACT|nr:ArsR family transcriptional regulator [Mariniphaga anaerophila]
MNSLFSGLITSKTRIKILMRLFLNPERKAYLRELSDEFNASPSQVREELRQLDDAGFLKSHKKGRQILYQANQKHTLFRELQSMVQKALGMDRILDSILDRLGNLEEAYLIDDYAEGKDTGIIDLVLVGDIDQTNLQDLTRKTEKYIDRKIRTLVLTQDEYTQLFSNPKKRPQFLLWKSYQNSSLYNE